MGGRPDVNPLLTRHVLDRTNSIASLTQSGIFVSGLAEGGGEADVGGKPDSSDDADDLSENEPFGKQYSENEQLVEELAECGNSSCRLTERIGDAETGTALKVNNTLIGTNSVDIYERQPVDSNLPSKTKGIYRQVEIMDQATNSQNRFCDNTVTTSKYTMLNFVPKCLFEQFRRAANVYFLIISLLQVGTNLSPTSKYATIVPLMGVVSVTMIKEAIEDYQRHLADRAVNSNMTKVVDRNGGLLEVSWRDVRVGDILELTDGDEVCCDGVLLSSCTDQGLAYVETSCLDGETNLKVRESCHQTSRLRAPAALAKLHGSLQCELPNANMYRFRGSLQITSFGEETTDQTSLKLKEAALQNVIFRGSFLKNSPRAYILVVYTGKDTKQVLNTRAAPSKRSNIDQLINSTIFLVFLTLVAMCTISTILFSIWVKSNSGRDAVWYLPFLTDNATSSKLTSFITFLILYNNLVPISLYVTLEIVKMIQAALIDSDIRMFYSSKKMAAQARTSNLNEDLGQIEHIFCDKTGTLTCNSMVFRECAVNGVIYDACPTKHTAVSSIKFKRSKPGYVLAEIIKGGPSVERDFLRVMSLCHTVLPNIVKAKGRLVHRWQASSPDEEALVVGSIGYGYRLLRRNHNSLVVNIESGISSTEAEFKLLSVIEFTSQRKCMSIVVRTPENVLMLLCKGADDVILSKMAPGQESKIKSAQSCLHRFATKGLRTLVMAQAVLDDEFYVEWNCRYQQARNSLSSDKDEQLEILANEVEVDLSLLGISGIEDRLQAGVPEAIRLLLAANIKLWVLTGDKIETAVNIGKSSSMLSKNMQVLRFTSFSENDIDAALRTCEIGAMAANKKQVPLGMVIDGRTLTLILDHKRRCRVFIGICQMCNTVIACRASPKQKASIVAMVKRLVRPEPMTLAIGDGANDIGMLQEAHVGVGISGNEGMQAVNSADYAIGQFRYLSRLCLVHGNWNYRRISKVVLYSFYKNICSVFTLFFYCFYNGFSGSSLYESWLQAGWNVGWTFLPIVVFGITDKDVHSTTILAHPHVYARGQRHDLFNLKIMTRWVTIAIIHASILFLLSSKALQNDASSADGTTHGMVTLGTIINGCMVLLVNIKLLLEAKHWNKYTVGSVIFSVAIWFAFIGLYSNMITISFDFFGEGERLYETVLPWLVFLLVSIAAVILDLSLMYLSDMYFPDPIVIANELQSINGLLDEDESFSEQDDTTMVLPTKVTEALPKKPSALKKKCTSLIPDNIEQDRQKAEEKITTVRHSKSHTKRSSQARSDAAKPNQRTKNGSELFTPKKKPENPIQSQTTAVKTQKSNKKQQKPKSLDQKNKP